MIRVLGDVAFVTTVFSISLVLSACQMVPEQTVTNNSAASKNAVFKNNVQQYQCDEQVVIHRQKLDEDTIRLGFSHRIFELTQFSVPDKSQNFYRTEQGLSQGKGLLWIENEQQATLKTMLFDPAIHLEDYPVIYQCQLKS